MTIPTFEGGDIPELPSAEPPRVSPSIHMHVSPEMNSIRMIVRELFTFIKMPQMQFPIEQLAAHKIPQHELIKHMIHKFNPSIPQLAVLSNLQTQSKVEKAPSVENPKESGSQRDETAGKQSQGENPVNIEVFSGEKSQGGGAHQQGSSKGEAKPPTEVQPVTPKPSDVKPSDLSKGAFQELNIHQPQASKQEPSVEKPVSLPEAPIAKIPSEGQSGTLVPRELQSESSLTQNKQPATENPQGTKPPEAKVPELKPQEPKSQDVEFQKGNAAETKLETAELKPALPAEKAAAAESTFAQTENGKISGGKEFQPTQQSPLTSTQLKAEGPQPKPSTEPKLIQEPKDKVEFQKSALAQTGNLSLGKKEEIPPQRTDAPHEHAQVELHKHIAEQKYAEVVIPAAIMESHIPKGSPGDQIQMHHHRIFQAIDRDLNAQIPPWLAQLLPDLTKTELHKKKGGGAKPGKVSQNPHKLTDMLFMLYCASLGGAKSLVEVIQFIEKREKWFMTVLGLRHGLPPRQLFFWLLATLDARKFDLTVYSWLKEMQGSKQLHSSMRWLDINLWQTAIGFIVGQAKHANAQSDLNMAVKLVNGFQLQNCAVMTRAESSYGSLLGKIKQSGGDYLAEVQEELHPEVESHTYESYLEGQERVIVQEWSKEGVPEACLKVDSEFFGPQGVLHSQEFYLSSLEEPASHYFDLSRAQRPYANKVYWLLNIALSFPSIDIAIQHCNTTLSKFQLLARERIALEGFSIEKLMQRAAQDSNFLMQLTQMVD